MYHVVFGSDDNYVKFSSVLMSSIIDNLNQDYENEPICFHIITNYLSKDTLVKINSHIEQLNKKYPCLLKIHTISIDDFIGLPDYLSYAIYFRLKIDECLLEGGSIHKCLYLDVDMMVCADIRELWHIDVKNYVACVVGDMGHKSHKLISKSNNDDIRLGEDYFNSGFLFINLDMYKKLEISKRIIHYIKNYNIKTGDQDLLNAAIPNDKRLKLDFAYNFVGGAFGGVVCKDEKKNRLNYTRAEFEKSAKNPKIIHYKFWLSKVGFIDKNGVNLNKLWWDIAFNVESFKHEFKAMYDSMSGWEEMAKFGYFALRAGFLQKLKIALGARLPEINVPKKWWNLSLVAGEAVIHIRKKKMRVFKIFAKMHTIKSELLKYNYSDTF